MSLGGIMGVFMKEPFCPEERAAAGTAERGQSPRRSLALPGWRRRWTLRGRDGCETIATERRISPGALNLFRECTSGAAYILKYGTVNY